MTSVTFTFSPDQLSDHAKPFKSTVEGLHPVFTPATLNSLLHIGIKDLLTKGFKSYKFVYPSGDEDIVTFLCEPKQQPPADKVCHLSLVS